MTPARVAGTIGDMDLVELSRLVENLLRIGTIHSVDHAACRVRVQTGNITTDWLRWLETRAGNTTTWDPPTVGEQCIVLSPSGEIAQGIVLYGAPSEVIDTPSHSPDQHVTRYPDGTEISYDHTAGLHQASYPDGATISYHHPSGALQAAGIITGLVEAATSITLDTPLTHITGKCVIDDLLTYGNGLAGTGGANNNIITGNLTHTGNHTHSGGSLSSNGKVLHSHAHSGVIAGGANTGAPV